MAPSPQQVTQLLVAWRGGDQAARDELMPLGYEELRRLAHQYEFHVNHFALWLSPLCFGLRRWHQRVPPFRFSSLAMCALMVRSTISGV